MQPGGARRARRHRLLRRVAWPQRCAGHRDEKVTKHQQGWRGSSDREACVRGRPCRGGVRATGVVPWGEQRPGWDGLRRLRAGAPPGGQRRARTTVRASRRPWQGGGATETIECGVRGARSPLRPKQALCLDRACHLQTAGTKVRHAL